METNTIKIIGYIVGFIVWFLMFRYLHSLGYSKPMDMPNKNNGANGEIKPDIDTSRKDSLGGYVDGDSCDMDTEQVKTAYYNDDFDGGIFDYY